MLERIKQHLKANFAWRGPAFPCVWASHLLRCSFLSPRMPLLSENSQGGAWYEWCVSCLLLLLSQGEALCWIPVAGWWQQRICTEAALPPHLPLPCTALTTLPQTLQFQVIPTALLQTSHCFWSSKSNTGEWRGNNAAASKGKSCQKLCLHTHLLMCPFTHRTGESPPKIHVRNWVVPFLKTGLILPWELGDNGTIPPTLGGTVGFASVLSCFSLGCVSAWHYTERERFLACLLKHKQWF